MPREKALDILWRGREAIAIDKPPDLATIPGRAESDSVLERLGRQLGLAATGAADARVRIVHRLDKQTSGVLLLALSSAAQRHLSGQFMKNQVRKEYQALVRGRPTAEEGVVDAPLARHPTSPQRMAIVRHGGRPAVTRWRVDKRFRDYALLRVFPQTGKTHQIRVHLQSIGLPLAIDPLYNTGASESICLSSFKRHYRRGSEPERPLISRLTLHAERLTFRDLDGLEVTVTSPTPKDLRAIVQSLEKYNR